MEKQKVLKEKITNAIDEWLQENEGIDNMKTSNPEVIIELVDTLTVFLAKTLAYYSGTTENLQLGISQTSERLDQLSLHFFEELEKNQTHEHWD